MSMLDEDPVLAKGEAQIHWAQGGAGLAQPHLTLVQALVLTPSSILH